MVSLVPQEPENDGLPTTIGDVTLTALPLSHLNSIAPFKGKETACSKALLTGFPAPGSWIEKNGQRAIWVGRRQMFFQGELPKDLPAAVTDQSNGWACYSLTGRGTRDVLARLCPADVAAMVPGDAIRSLLGHMNAVILRTEPGYEIFVFRSMAQTAVHEIVQAMAKLAARHELP